MERLTLTRNSGSFKKEHRHEKLNSQCLLTKAGTGYKNVVVLLFK